MPDILRTLLDRAGARDDSPVENARGPLALLALGLLGGAALLIWQWVHFRSKVREVHTTVPLDDEEPKPIPKEAQQGERPLQLTRDGTGPLFHRRYRADIAHPRLPVATLMERITCEINDFCPTGMARFIKSKGEDGRLDVGDEFDIHVTGPWNGPVRVIDVTDHSFSLLTLEGHFEAGEIRFRFCPHPTHPDALRFEILSWARSRDKFIDLAYNKMGLAKLAQTNMWVHFCTRVAEESGGELIGKIEVVTEELPFEEEVIPHE